MRALAGGRGGLGLPPLPHPQDSRHSACPELEPWSVCALDQAGADIISLGSLAGFVFTDQMLRRLTPKGKDSRTQIPPLKTWAKQGTTVAGVGFISQEDLC